MAAGFAPERLLVAAPGRDVAERPDPPPADLRRGRSAALLFVGNWLAPKGLLDLLEAVAALPSLLPPCTSWETTAPTWRMPPGFARGWPDPTSPAAW